MESSAFEINEQFVLGEWTVGMRAKEDGLVKCYSN